MARASRRSAPWCAPARPRASTLRPTKLHGRAHWPKRARWAPAPHVKSKWFHRHREDTKLCKARKPCLKRGEATRHFPLSLSLFLPLTSEARNDSCCCRRCLSGAGHADSILIPSNLLVYSLHSAWTLYSRLCRSARDLSEC